MGSTPDQHQEKPLPTARDAESITQETLQDLRQRVNKTDPQRQMVEYLADFPEVYVRYRVFRAHFLGSLQRYVNSPQSDQSKELAQQLARETPAKIDRYVLRLFRKMGIREQPEVLDQLFSNPVPNVYVVPPDMYPEAVEEGLNGWVEDGDIWLPDIPRTFEELEAILYHELMHGWLDNYEKFSLMREGISQYLADIMQGHTSMRFVSSYRIARDIATVLFEIDTGMTFKWYLGIVSSEHYYRYLYDYLCPHLGYDEAVELSFTIIELEHSLYYNLTGQEVWNDGDDMKFLTTTLQKLREAKAASEESETTREE